jgi:hypothetical protein
LRWQWPAAIVNDKPIISSDMMLYNGYNPKGSVRKRMMAVSLKELGTEMN